MRYANFFFTPRVVEEIFLLYLLLMHLDLVHPLNLFEVSMRSLKSTFELDYANWIRIQKSYLFHVTVIVRLLPHLLRYHLRYAFLLCSLYLQSYFWVIMTNPIGCLHFQPKNTKYRFMRKMCRTKGFSFFWSFNWIPRLLLKQSQNIWKKILLLKWKVLFSNIYKLYHQRKRFLGKENGFHSI